MRRCADSRTSRGAVVSGRRSWPLRARLGAGFFVRFLAVAEDLLERCAERVRYPERHLERRRVLAELDRVDRLPRHADLLGELLLRRSEERRVGKGWRC